MKRFLVACAILATLLGGAPAAAQTPVGRAVRGAVYDSLANAPLANASVSILNRSDTAVHPRTVRSDYRGRFEFSDVPPGAYLIGFQAPILDSLGVSSPTRVLRLAESGGAVIVNLAIPSAATLHDAFCPNRPKGDSTSVFVGHLSNANTLGVVPNGEIDATWMAVSRAGKKVSVDPHVGQTHSGADGWFALCDLPANTTIAMHAIAGSDTSGPVLFEMPEARGLVRHELYLADRNAPRTGVVVGRVVDAERARPIVGAQVRADVTGSTSTSADSGKFTLSALPYGTSDIVVRSIGFLPQRAVVDVIAGAPTSVTLSLLTSSNVLDTVRVRAARSVADDNGFSTRKKAGWGRFFDAEAILRMQPFGVSDVLLRVAGVKTVTTGSNSKIMMRNQYGTYSCQPDVYLDGRKLRDITNTFDLNSYAFPEDLAGIEVYTDRFDVPSEFAIDAPCGVIAMWSLPPEARFRKSASSSGGGL